MKINVVSSQELTPASLAECLASSSPEEFTNFWFEFATLCSDEKIKEFGEAMASDFGGKRKEPFKKLYTTMEYFEFKNRESDSD